MTEEEFADLLLKPHADMHAMEPAGDQQQLRDVQAALSSYRRETMLWAERRSASQPSLAHRARQGERRAAMPRWALALVGLVTIAGGVAHLTSDRGQEPDNSVAVTLPRAEQPAPADDLAADNHLLSSIDAELSYHGGSPVDALELQDGKIAEHTGAAGVTD